MHPVEVGGEWPDPSHLENVLPGRRRPLGSKGRSPQEDVHRVREERGLSDRHHREVSIGIQDLPEARYVGTHRRNPGGQRLEQGERTAAAPRNGQEDVGRGQDGADLAALSEQLDREASVPPELVLEGHPSRSGPHEGHVQVGMVPMEDRQRREETVGVLLR